MWVVTLVTAITSQYPGNGRPSLMENILTKIFKWHTWSQTISQEVSVIPSRVRVAALLAGEGPCVMTPALQEHTELTAPAHVCVRTRETVIRWLGSATAPWAGRWVVSSDLSVTWLTWEHLCDQGEVCANPCPTGTYHVDCKRRCDCYNGAVCDHVTGKCHCLPGFKGAKVGCAHCTGWCDPPLSIKSDNVLSSLQCQEQCPYGRYGQGCQQHCRCENGASCDPVDGRWGLSNDL